MGIRSGFITHSVAKVYSDAALPGLLGRGCSPEGRNDNDVNHPRCYRGLTYVTLPGLIGSHSRLIM